MEGVVALLIVVVSVILTFVCYNSFNDLTIEAVRLFLQEIVPHSSSGVVELFVSPSEVEVKKRKAEAMPKLNITKIDCQWLQVFNYNIL